MCSSKYIIIKNVNIISMANKYEKLEQNKTIIIRNNHIESINNDDKVQIPSSSTIIEANGKFLIPGLIDMHMHCYQFLPIGNFKNEGKLLLLNGVTTIRSMWGYHLGPLHPVIKAKEKTKNNTLSYPDIYTAGQILENKPAIFKNISTIVESEIKAKKIIIKEKLKGYNFIKVYHTLKKENYKYIAKYANENNVKFIGHLPKCVNIKEAIKYGQHSLEHLAGYINLFEKIKLDKSKFKEQIIITSDSEIWNCPTLVVIEKYFPIKKVDEYINTEGIEYLSPKIIEQSKKIINKARNFLATTESDYNAIKELVFNLYNSGAKMVIGTDSNNPLVIPGFSMHQEMENMNLCGISNYDVLKMATINAARCLGKENEIGTIQEGKKANIVLLNKNPLENIKNVKSIEKVFLRGNIFDRKSILKDLESKKR